LSSTGPSVRLIFIAGGSPPVKGESGDGKRAYDCSVDALPFHTVGTKAHSNKETLERKRNKWHREKEKKEQKKG